MKIKFTNPSVKKVFNDYPRNIKEKLLFIRQLIFETASKFEEVGELEETLKWGEPSYLPKKPKIGTTVRINQIKNKEGYFAIYFHCQTTLISTFKSLYPKEFKYEGNRAIIFNEKNKIPQKELSHCISLALTYHINKNKMF